MGMTDKKKTSRWTKNLRKAGLIGEVEDAWTLTESPLHTTPTIIVDDARKTDPPPAADDDDDGPEVIVLSDEPDAKAASLSTDPVPPADSPAAELHRMMHERVDMGDLSGALEISEQLLESAPNDSDASMTRLKCRKTLMQMYESRIGSFKRVPKRIISEEEIIWRNLDPVAGFIAAGVDGSVTFEDIIDISTLPRFEACRVLNQLLQDGIIK